MRKFEYVIKDQFGIHARPAGLIARHADKYKSRITLRIGGRPADAGKIMSIMMLGARCGQTLEVEMEGSDEDAAYEGMKALLEEIL
ncbi:phosphocarrier protein HPr [Marvinbryantia formatexigens DSM 14469]|uniref:Phosphocarrier protein HPr n=1 Tax=Marvinbryantia formatexigens DSM 14469 TaxID=478749 RepID=C6LAF9_9FIRM|nr:HPr family phosphocarrier protein [Marvinbryantia formatexigens]EET62566.1 phosphocarrier protein HPr [Marvinbryantia formatexigens DSM 14469]UWO23274.1 HPr family phosphocarrier protein [Marvinbryantia formatexigens DSM 14469]SDG61909.1 phosphocarrier protein [Marvinbryantia formatexigens]